MRPRPKAGCLPMEYYDRFFDPSLYTRQAAHDGLWHG
jgi:hypothetical protein